MSELAVPATPASRTPPSRRAPTPPDGSSDPAAIAGTALQQVALPTGRGRRERRLGRVLWERIRGDGFSLAALAALVLVVLLCALASWLPLKDPLRQDPSQRLLAPLTPGYWLGSDQLGRDILSRLVWGGRISLVVGIAPVLVSAVVGVTLGVLGGYYGGYIDGVLMRVLDIVFAFPAILLALAIVATLGPSLSNAMLAITVVAIPSFARLVRSSVLSVKEQAFVEAARALGAGHGRIMLRHILPNSLSHVVVYGTLETGKTIVFAAGLSFLGLGAQPPTPEWGAMLSDGRNVLAVAPHVPTMPGLAILVVTLSLNTLGDVLRDALDPRSRPA